MYVCGHLRVCIVHVVKEVTRHSRGLGQLMGMACKITHAQALAV